jgi:hypothetical protein
VSSTEARRQAAARYIPRGVAVIPVPNGKKKPGLPGWQDLRLTAEDVPRYWTNGQNIGVLNGEPSGWRVCVDQDVSEAGEIAGRFLLPTLTSGRKSRPHSHWWYTAPGAPTEKFKDVDGTMLLELRSTGCQTIVAPSIHPSGDRYVWHGKSGLKMAHIGAAELKRHLRELATAVLIARHLPKLRDESTGEGGGRHDYALALSGFLLRPGRLEEALVKRILKAAWDAKGWRGEREKREAHSDLEGIVRDTAGNLARGEPVVGGPTLEEMEPGMVRQLRKYWGWHREEEKEEEPSAYERVGYQRNGHPDGAGPIGTLLSEVVPERVRWLWEGRIALGKLNLVDGDPGTGKSAATTDLAARVSVGKPRPEGSRCEGGGVVILSAEDGLADTIRPRFDAAGGDPSRAVAVSTVPDAEGNERQIAIPDDLHVIETAIERVGALLVVIDPLMAFLSGEVNSHRDQDVRRTLAPLARLAERTRAAIVVVRHLNKGTGGNALYRGGGSIGIVGAARSGLLIAKHPEDDGRRVLASIKSNLAPPAPSLVFGLSSTESGAVRVDWKGESNLDAAALLSAPTDHEERSALSEAQEFLREVLSGGPQAASDVKREADSAGIAKRTLDRARQSLDVVSEREGEPGKRGGGKWYWRLPEIKAANPKGWHSKSVADRADGENSAYLSQESSPGLRLPNTEDVNDASGLGNLNRPSSAEPRLGEPAVVEELRTRSGDRLTSQEVRELFSRAPGWLRDQTEHCRRHGAPKPQVEALAAAVAAHLSEDPTRGREVLAAVEAQFHALGCGCEECS